MRSIWNPELGFPDNQRGGLAALRVLCYMLLVLVPFLLTFTLVVWGLKSTLPGFFCLSLGLAVLEDVENLIPSFCLGCLHFEMGQLGRVAPWWPQHGWAGAFPPRPREALLPRSGLTCGPREGVLRALG